MRVPNYYPARSLARRAGKPLIATSVNISGRAVHYNLRNLHKKFISKDIAILNAGILSKDKPSTVVECKDSKLIIHRQGSVDIYV